MLRIISLPALRVAAIVRECSWGHVEVAHVSHVLPDGRILLDDVSFRIGEGITPP